MIVSTSHTFGSPQVKRLAPRGVRRARPGVAAVRRRKRRKETARAPEDHPRRLQREAAAYGLVFADDPMLQYAGLGSWLKKTAKKVKKAVSIKNVAKVAKAAVPVAALVTPLAPVALAAKVGVASKLIKKVSPLISKAQAVQKAVSPFVPAVASLPIPTTAKTGGLSILNRALDRARSNLAAKVAAGVPLNTPASQVPVVLPPGEALPGEQLVIDGQPAVASYAPNGQLVAQPQGGLPSWVIPAAIAGAALLVLPNLMRRR